MYVQRSSTYDFSDQYCSCPGSRRREKPPEPYIQYMYPPEPYIQCTVLARVVCAALETMWCNCRDTSEVENAGFPTDIVLKGPLNINKH